MLVVFYFFPYLDLLAPRRRRGQRLLLCRRVVPSAPVVQEGVALSPRSLESSRGLFLVLIMEWRKCNINFEKIVACVLLYQAGGR